MSRLGGAGAVAQLVADIPLQAVEVINYILPLLDYAVEISYQCLCNLSQLHSPNSTFFLLIILG